jgi:AraC family transcriptional regulator
MERARDEEPVNAPRFPVRTAFEDLTECRVSKQSFGVPPHRYHMNRRIERAKTLLVDLAL